MPEHKTRVAILFGGRSAEHDVSCVTAAQVLRATDPLKYDLVPVGITHDGVRCRTVRCSTCGWMSLVIRSFSAVNF